MEDLFAVLLGTTAVSAVGAGFSLMVSLNSPPKKVRHWVQVTGILGMVSFLSFPFLEVPLRV